jgi:HD-GYP domain-containing protein (c-di-GMP phosphodiesterase class II)
MRRVLLEKVEEGSVLGKPIYTSDGNILLNAGMRLKESYIARLKELNINYIYVDDNISYDISIEDVISDETRFEARLAIRKAMDFVKLGQKLDTIPIRNVVNNIIDDILYKKDLIVNLSDIRSTDDYTFCHSVNVCVLSVLNGVALGYDREKLHQLGMGAILHDVGKTKIPQEVLLKPDVLNKKEYEIAKMHTNYGYEILSESDEFSVYSKYIALTHHERVDGNGYPLGLKDGQIHEFSKIVSISDVYDALTSDRVYKKSVKISDAVDFLVGMSNHMFDHELVKSFLKHIAIYPIGTIVNLSTGEKAIVVDINKDFRNRPIVRVIEDYSGNHLDSFIEIDLTKTNSVFITGIIEDY